MTTEYHPFLLYYAEPPEAKVFAIDNSSWLRSFLPWNFFFSAALLAFQPQIII
jgi:hypothetical protein